MRPEWTKLRGFGPSLVPLKLADRDYVQFEREGGVTLDPAQHAELEAVLDRYRAAAAAWAQGARPGTVRELLTGFAERATALYDALIELPSGDAAARAALWQLGSLYRAYRTGAPGLFDSIDDLTVQIQALVLAAEEAVASLPEERRGASGNPYREEGLIRHLHRIWASADGRRKGIHWNRYEECHVDPFLRLAKVAFAHVPDDPPTDALGSRVEEAHRTPKRTTRRRR